MRKLIICIYRTASSCWLQMSNAIQALGHQPPLCWLDCDYMYDITQKSGYSRKIIRRSRGDPDSKVHEANMGPIWDRQDPGGPHVGPMNFAIWGGLERVGWVLSTSSSSRGYKALWPMPCTYSLRTHSPSSQMSTFPRAMHLFMIVSAGGQAGSVSCDAMKDIRACHH